MLAGPNGSGKSTLYETRIAPRLKVPFINADIIQRDELKQTDMKAAYKAAKIAAERRDKHLENRESFATESVFSHPSKLLFIKQAIQADYRILMFHISVENANLSVARVNERVSEGGHNVPEEKIRARYTRSEALIRQAVLISDIAHIYDNSNLNQPPERVMTFTKGRPGYVFEFLPQWVLRVYAEDLNAL